MMCRRSVCLRACSWCLWYLLHVPASPGPQAAHALQLLCGRRESEVVPLTAEEEDPVRSLIPSHSCRRFSGPCLHSGPRIVCSMQMVQ